MQISELDEVTCDAWVDGEPSRRTLDRLVLEGGAWATVMLLYQDRARAADGGIGDDWRPARVMIVRLQRRGGGWRRHASATLASAASARALSERLSAWYSPAAIDGRGERDDQVDDTDETDAE